MSTKKKYPQKYASKHMLQASILSTYISVCLSLYLPIYLSRDIEIHTKRIQKAYSTHSTPTKKSKAKTICTLPPKMHTPPAPQSLTYSKVKLAFPALGCLDTNGTNGRKLLKTIKFDWFVQQSDLLSKSFVTNPDLE